MSQCLRKKQIKSLAIEALGGIGGIKRCRVQMRGSVLWERRGNKFLQLDLARVQKVFHAFTRKY